MVPAIFFLSTFKDQVKGQRFKVQCANDYVISYGHFYVIVGLKRVISKGNTLQCSKMRLTNDLENLFGKVKVI